MGEQGSAWVLCPSKKFPGKFYYFNTQNGEKAWSWNDPTNKLHIESREDGSPKMVINFNENTQAGYKQMPNDPVSPGKSVLLHTESGELFCSSTISNSKFTDNPQDKCKQMPNNPYSWRQPKEQHSDSREFSSPMSENCSGNAHATGQLMPNNPFSSRQLNQSHAEFRKFGTPTVNSSNLSGNTHSEYKLVPNKPNTFPSKQRKRVYKEMREFGSTSSSNLSNSQAKLMPQNLFLMRQPKQLNTRSRKFSPTATPKNKIKARYKPMLNNPFSSRLPKQFDCDELGQPKKRIKLEIPLASPIYEWDIDDAELISNNSSSATINQYRMNDSMKIIIDIIFLRNLSKSESIKEWHIVPDVEVLLENLEFLNEFISGDPTCTLMTPAAVLKKLQSLADSRTTADQVFQWLAKHSVCEINNQDEYPLNENTINEQIIKFCLEAKILHMVIITNKQCLRDAARRNGVHAFCISELKIIKESVEDKNDKDNLFLQDSNSLDPFIISKSLHILNTSTKDEFTNYINENNNNTTVNNLNWPNLKTSDLLHMNNHKITRPYEGIDFRVQYNEDGTSCYTQNFDKNNWKNIIHTSGRYLRNLRISFNNNKKPFESEKVEENPPQNVKSNSQKPVNRFEGFRFNTSFDTNMFHNNSSETNENQNVVKSIIQNRINRFEALKLNTPIDKSVINHSSKVNKYQNVGIRNAQKEINRFEGISCNTFIKKSVFSNHTSKIPILPKNQNVNLSAPTSELFVFQNNSPQIKENQSAVKRNAQKEVNQFEVAIFNTDLNSNLCNGTISKIYEDYEKIEDQLIDFCTKHSNLQNYINNRVDEWSCCFVQIIEQFMDDVFQCTPIKKFDPPYWFQQGLKCLREHYSQNKYIGTIIDKLIGMCGYCIKNGVVRTNIKADQFLNILGAGMLLIERIDRIAQFPEISGFYKEMLSHLVTTIQDPEDFPEMLSLSLELSLRIGDAAYHMENVEMFRIFNGH